MHPPFVGFGLWWYIIHLAAKHKARECYFLTRKFFPCCCLAARYPAIHPCCHRGLGLIFCHFSVAFLLMSRFFSFLSCDSFTLDADINHRPALPFLRCPDPSTGGLIGPWEFSRLLPHLVGMWLGMTLLLKVCLSWA